MMLTAYKERLFSEDRFAGDLQLLGGVFACTPLVKIAGYSLYVWFACFFALLAAVLIRLRPRLTAELGDQAS